MRRVVLSTVVALAVAMAASVASAEIILPGNPNWGAFGNTGGGSSAITGAQPRSGDGSLEMTGDRTRFGTFSSGNPFSGGTSPGMGLLNDVKSLSFDWQVAVGSVSGLSPDLTPALRLHIWDPNAVNQRSELIWEGAYNDTYGHTTQGTWYTSGAADKFWRYVAGIGETNDMSALVTLSIEDWAANASSPSSGGLQWYSDDAFIYGISVGVGSGAGTGYHAFADNVQFVVGNESTTYNFNLTNPAAAEVPEPASLAVWSLMGVAGLAYRWRSKKRASV